MSAKPMRLVTVPTNGQISIGTKWAGKQIRIEELSESEIHISAGTFVPESQREFYTKESTDRLNEFDQWEAKNATVKESARDTLSKIKRKRQSRGR